MFDEENITHLLKLCDKYLPDENKDIIKEYLIVSNGYKLSYKNQLYNYVNIHYNRPYFSIPGNKNTYQYCESEPTKFNFIHKIGMLKGKPIHPDGTVRYNIFKYILPRLKNIQGLIYKQIDSNFLVNGKYEHEEILLNGNTFLHNLEFDTKDEKCWTNYRLKNNYRNMHIVYDIGNQGHILELKYKSPNENFSLFNFYKNHKLITYTKIDKTKQYIMSYNLHHFNNLSFKIKLEENIVLILRLIKHYRQNVDVLFFQEFNLNEELEQKFMMIMDHIGYKHHIITENGHNGLKLICFTKDKYESIIVDTTYDTIDPIIDELKKEYYITKLNEPRKQIILNYKSKYICGVHLCIGNRLPIKEDIRIINLNSTIRCSQLEKILKYNPYMIIGDFNFTKEDKEHQYLKDHKYYLLDNDNDNSTPYNRVDHVYCKNKKKLENKLLVCNYSDHLPLIHEIMD